MQTTTIRVSTEVWQLARALSKERKIPLSNVVKEALHLLEAEQLLSAADNAYQRLRRESERHQEQQEEFVEWETTLNDGLADD